MADSIKFISPKGEAYYPSVNKTETYKGKDTGKFTMKLALEGESLETTKKMIDDLLVDAYGPKKAAQVWAEKSPIKTTKDGEKSFIKFTANAVIDGKPRSIAIFDSKGKPVKRELNIGSGSLIRVKGSISVFPVKDPGIAFYMNSVQVIRYVEYVPGGGFDAADDEDGEGFSADEFDNDSFGGEDGPADTASHSRADF